MPPSPLAVFVLAVSLAAPTFGQETAEIRAYLARLAGRDLHAEVVREGETWLRANGSDPAGDVVRYRVGCAHLALGRDGQGLALLEPLAAREGFEFAAESAVRAAEARLRTNDPTRAERLLARVVQSARGSTRDAVLALLVRARLALDQTEPALVAARSLRTDGSTAESRREGALLEAWGLVRAGRGPEAAKSAQLVIDDAAATPAERGEAQVVLGEALLGAERPADARRAFESVPEGPWRVAALRGIGFAEKSAARPVEAARAFIAAAQLEPEGPYAAECTLHAGIESLAAGDARSARELLAAKVLDSVPDAAEWRARAALADGDPESALREVTRARSAKSDAARSARLARIEGEAHEKAGRGKDAARSFAADGSAAGSVEAARASLTVGDAQAALRHARAALDAKPDARTALSAFVALGEAAFRLERWPDARAAFEAAIPLETDVARGARIRLRAAWSAWEGGEPAVAASHATTASAGLPANEREEADFLAARALGAARDPAERAAWSAFLDRHGASARAAEAALHLARMSEPAEARTLLTRALERESDPARAAEIALELGELAARANDHAAARAAYEQVLARGGAHGPQASYGLAFACSALGDAAAAERAIAPLLTASDIDADLARAAFELATVFSVRAGDAVGALTRWRGFSERGASSTRALTSLRGVLPLLKSAGSQKDAEKALAELAGRSRGGELAAVEIERAWFALEGGDGVASARSLERAVKAGGDPALLVEVRIALGDHLLEKGDGASARREFLAAVVPGSKWIDKALVRLAWSRLSANEDAAALADLERFERECAASPERPRALALRGEALWRLGRYEECAESLTLARSLVRDAATKELVVERLGSALVKLDRQREAADVWGDFVREFPRSSGVPAAELARGRALARLGDTRGARASLERAVSAGGAIAARARLEKARIAATAGDLDAALSDALKAALLVDDPECAPDALLLAAEILAQQGEVAASRARLAELAERYPRSDAATRAKTLEVKARGASAPSKGGAR